MYIIIMNKDKTLTTSKRINIYEGDKLADKVQFLFPQVYNGINLDECAVRINFRDLVGLEQSEVLVKDDELYKNRLSYRYPIDSKFTRSYGDIIYYISFSVMTDEETETEDVLFHTGSHMIKVLPRPDSVPPEEIFPEDSAGKILKEVYKIEERVDELEKDKKAIQSDWEQNDESQVNYIKNRTHYNYQETIEINETIGNDAISDELYQALITRNVENLIFFKEDHIFFKSESEKAISYYINDNYNKTLSLNKETRKVFVAEYYPSNPLPSFYLGSFSATGYYTNDVLKQLDEKYIPNNIQRSEPFNELAERVSYIENEGFMIISDDGTFTYINDGTDKLKFNIDETLITDDGQGNVVITSAGISVSDDGEGNLTITIE